MSALTEPTSGSLRALAELGVTWKSVSLGTLGFCFADTEPPRLERPPERLATHGIATGSARGARRGAAAAAGPTKGHPRELHTTYLRYGQYQ